jgi:amino acid adenylation domain-containing protein/non-ribosomal peptide synthase protein (TIGR01720 family)
VAEGIALSGGHGRSAAGAGERDRILAAPPGERLALAEAYLLRELPLLLHTTPAALLEDRSLFAHGLDSLTAAELAAALESDLAAPVPIAELLAGPCLSELAARVVQQLGAAAADTAPAAAPTLPAPAAAGHPLIWPLSAGQRALWLLDRMVPGGNPACLIAGAARIRGELPAPRLRRALAALVERHPELRATFEMHGEEAVQVIHAGAAFGFAEEDAAAWSDAVLQARIAAAAHQPCDPARGPLLHVTLLHRTRGALAGGAEHLVVLVVHHAVADFRSLEVLLGELAAIERGETLPPLAASYEDFVRSQAELLAGPAAQRLEAFWTAALPAAPPLELPTDRPRPPLPSFRGDSRPLRLGPEITDRLYALSRRAGVSPFMTLLAAFAALLHRYSGQEEILVGTPAAGRAPALAGLVGYFVNPVVICGRLAGAPTFDELLVRVKATAIAAFGHQDYPFSLIAERLGGNRDASRSPVFQALLVLYRDRQAGRQGLGAFALGAGGAKLDLGGLVLESIELPRQSAQLDLALLMAEVDGALAGSLQFAADLFDASTAVRILAHLRTLIAAVVGRDDRPQADAAAASISGLPLLTSAERHQLLVAWNDTGELAADPACLHQLFERQAAATPDLPALLHDGATTSYGELDRWAGRIARHLRSMGAGPEVPVGICLERRPEMLAAILAVLKAGAAYVPLDPAYPRQRIAWIVADTRMPVLISTGELARRLPRHPPALLDMAAFPARAPAAASLAGRAPASLPPAAAPAPLNLAYVIYTSGSSGRPKGVAITHASAVAFVRWAMLEFAPAELAGVLAATSICFDLSVFEIFAPLSGGGAVVLADNALALPSLAAAGAVTLINTVPSVMAELLRAGGLPPRLRTVNLAGEPLPRQLVDRLWQQPAVARVLNLYGPSEDTTYSTWAELGRRDLLPPAIGRPLAATRAYVVDRQLAAVPAGVPGELLLGGGGLARGYLGRPELTAERFIPDPFARRPPAGDAGGGAGEAAAAGGRLYRTGDLVRWRAGGTLEFLDRCDRQVKIRGFRIEPAEVEAVLREQAAVRDAAVVVRRDPPHREPRLVAYVVPAAAGDEAAALADEASGPERSRRLCAELLDVLRDRLPAFLVPAALVPLAALPRTASGKVDHGALAAGALGAAASTDTAALEGEAPRTPAEELLAGIWAEVLGLPRERLRSRSDFLALGGHSLLAAQLVSRARRIFGVELPLRRVFEHPTLAAMADELTAGGLPSPLPLAPLPAAARLAPLPLSFAQERMWFIERLQPGTTAYNMPVALRLRGPLAPGLLRRSLRQVVRRQESLRTTFGAAGGVPCQRIAPPSSALDLPLPVTDLGALPAARRRTEMERLAAWSAAAPFDLERGPLLRAHLLRLAAAEQVLLLDVHHIVFDGWSMRLLLGEIARLYAAFAAGGEDGGLPQLPIQYADFAHWQRRWLRGEVLAAQLAYWRAQLGGELPVLDLPLDRPRPAVQTFRGGARQRLLPPDLVARLAALGQREGATLFMTLLAAFAVLLQRHSGQDDVLVGTPIAGRDRAEIEAVMGCFVNNLVLRTDLSGAPSFRELLARVRRAALGAYSHQHLPFEQLLQELRPERDLSRTPLFQVLFNFQQLPELAPALADVAVEIAGGATEAAKFDLTLYLAERGGAIRLDAVYNADLFAPDRIAGLLEQYAALLDQAAERPDAAIESFSLVAGHGCGLLPDPTAELDAGWVGAVHELFAARARRAPERLAVIDPEGAWTYGELERQSNRLANRLLAAGIGGAGAEAVVAIYAHRSATLVWALLGVLKAHAAFVVLDPAYPAARQVEIVELVRPRAWLEMTAAGPPPAALEACLAALPHCPRLTLPPWPSLAGEAAGGGADSAPRLAVGPDELALVALTSGSTGAPKAILGRHGALSHFLPWQARHFGLGEDDRFSMLSGLAHDPLQRDVFTPLHLGAAICIPDPAQMGAAGWLASWMRRERVSVANLTPAMAQLLTVAAPGAAPAVAAAATAAATAGRTVPALRFAFLVGEVLTRRDVARLRRLAPAAAVVNLYGCTETQRALAYHVAAAPSGPSDAAGEPPASEVLPLGRGMQDCQLLVLGRAGQLAAVGELGEIWVRSPHLARGYLNDAAATAERFRLNHFTGRDGDRLYRTGDLGRYLPDGEVAFAGRADNQVKIRGFRIEPGEIEARLGRLAGVREAVVVAAAAGEGSAGQRLVAFVVAEPGASCAAADLRRQLRRGLPAHMIPAALVSVAELPRTPGGKIDRRALRRLAAAAPPEIAPPAPGAARQAAAGSGGGVLLAAVESSWRELLGIQQVGPDDNFFDRGGHSLLLAQLHARLQELAGREFPLLDLFQHPTVAAQAEHLLRLQEAAVDAGGPRHRAAAAAAPPEDAPRAAWRRPAESQPRGVAIIGMAGRFPGAPDVEQLWRQLRDGVDAISRFSDEQLLAAGVEPELLRNPRYVKAGGVVEGEDLFDAAFFDYAPREAELLDPQHRLFLECAHQALEAAGHDPERCRGAIGVYGGVGNSGYLLHNLLSNPDLLATVGLREASLANSFDYLTTRVSYKLGLRGPSVDVQTACSTSLVAVHLACQALLAGECDMALAGGASLRSPQRAGYLHEEGSVESATGVCRAFDAAADGTVWGSGAGVVVLRRLADALADGDAIAAVILGTAINNDGSEKVGFTAPSIAGQVEVIAAAQTRAGCAAQTIRYVECHGTGTPLGDPIEVAALARVFGAGERRASCALGSIKTNLGHLGAAAGVAGLIKAALALERREIPASLHFTRPNPQIDLDASPFFVNTGLTEWRAEDGMPRRAGVSSFGLGGTNAHLVLEEAPPAVRREPSGPSRHWQLLVLSAKTAAALEAATDNLAAWLGRSPQAPLADVCHTLQAGRRAFPWRRAVVCQGAEEAREALAGRDPRRLLGAPPQAARRRRPVAFLFPGQGAQHVDMGRGLYDSEPIFRRELDACARLLAPLLGRDLRQALYPAAARRAEAARELDQTRLAQPALFAVEYALARLWTSWGVAPWAMLGHSLGELVAACLAGVFSLADALALAAARGALMQQQPAGAMLSVELSEAALAPLLLPPLELAAVNAAAVTVACGPLAAVAELEAQLRRQGVGCRRLRTSHAFHSATMEPVVAPLGELLAGMRLSPPAVPYLSNLSGDWITAGEATDPGYWAAHLRQPVRFGAGAERLLAAEGQPLVLEVGPGRALGGLLRRLPAAGSVISSMRHHEDSEPDERCLLRAAGRLWLAGGAIDWAGFQAGAGRRRVALPTYPFERRRVWIEPGSAALGALAAPGAAGATAGWLHAYGWRSSLLPRAAAGDAAASPWLLLADRRGVGGHLAKRLTAAGARVIRAAAGSDFAGSPARGFQLAPGQLAHYRRLFDELGAGGLLPGRIVWLWGLDAAAQEGEEGAAAGAAASLFAMAAALAAAAGGRRVEIVAVGSRLHEIGGAEPLLAGACTLAACEGIALSFRSLACRSVDLPAPCSGEARRRLAGWLADELCRGGGDAVVAYDAGGRRSVRTLTPLAAGAQEDRLPPGAACLVIGEPAALDDPLATLEAEGGLRRQRALEAAVPPRGALSRGAPPAAGGAGAQEAAGDEGEDGDEGAALWRPFALALAAATHRVEALERLAQRRPPAACLLVVDSAAGSAAAAAAAVAAHAALRHSRAGEVPWIAVSVPASAMTPRLVAAALRLALAAGGSPQVVVVPPQAALRRAGRQAARESAGGAEREWAGGGEREPAGGAEREPAGGAERQPAPPDGAARNQTEAHLVELFERLLGVSPVGIHDDFFELGGHSLLGSRLLALLAGELGAELSIRALFEAPTPAALARRLDAAAAAAPAGGEPLPPIERLPRDAEIPASFAQQRLWFLDQLSPGGAAYNLPMAVTLRGAASWPALAAGLAEIRRRHEALRTRFRLAAGGPLQVIDGDGAPPPPPLPVVELGALLRRRPAAGRREALRLVRQESERPFDLARGPVLRAALLRLASAEHLLVLNLHHVAGDGWSLGLLLRELALLYSAARDGRPSPLPELPIQYADFAVWQRRRLAGAAVAAELAFWRRQLDGIPPLELPTDQPRPAVPSECGESCPLALAASLGPALEALCGQQRITLFMALFAAFAALLNRYTGQVEIAVGTPVAGRTHPQTEALIGLFVNTLVLRAGLGGEPTVAGFLARVRDTTLDAFAHQELPFEQLVGELQPDRDLSRTPLFQAMLALQNTPVEAPEVAGLALTVEPAEARGAKFDLSLALREAGGRLLGRVEVRAGLWDAVTVRRLAQHYHNLLAALAAGGGDPRRRLADLPLLAPAERQQLREWNDAAAVHRQDRCLHELFAEQARRTPGAPAVVAGDERLSYRELNARANLLARRLRRLGAGPETVVAVLVERSLAMVVGLLAVLKAGAAYLPLDPDHPRDRLRYMLQDSGARLLLTRRDLAAAAGPAAAAVHLDEPAAPWCAPLPRHGRGQADAASGVQPDNLAYLIYTSGSTGRPKGTMNSHRGIVNRLLWMQQRYRLEPDDRLLQKTPLSFDVSVWELFWPLVGGACLVMARPGGHRDPAYLAATVAAERITQLHFVPSMLRAFLDHLGEARHAAGLRGLRRVFASGEALSLELQQLYHGVLAAPLHNLYGPTEAAVEVTCWTCDPGRPRAVPIGRPLANTRIHLLDGDRREVPIGVPGELHIGGVQLARGYLGRPGLTAEKFVPDPGCGARGEPGCRLYRTGDLARYLPDGAIEYLGRLDTQVKIRGFRIELGEIEVVLGQHPAVREAVAMVREDRPGERRLTAYVVPAGAVSPRAEQLRAHLQERLPDYMVPSAFVELAALPLTPSGKLDRRALPPPAAGLSAAGDRRFAAPRTAAEQLLAGIWQELLGLPAVGVHDNFFELGGDSILSILVVSRAARAGLRLTPRQLFEQPTVAGLARLAAPPAVAAAAPAAVAGPLPLTPIQRWFFAQQPVHPEHFNQALLLEIEPVAPRVLAQAWQQLLEHHDALRLRFAPGGPGEPWRQWLAAAPAAPAPAPLAANDALAWIDLAALGAERFAAALEAAASLLQASLDLERGPLARLALFTHAAGRPRLLAIVHHLAVDGVSWRVLLEDLETACRPAAPGAAVALPARTAAFGAWAEQLQALAATAETALEAAGWRQRLALPVAPLPVDGGGEPEAADDRVSQALTASVDLDAGETRALLQEAPRAYRAQIAELLLAALALAFQAWTGERRLLLDLEGHGREEAGGLDLSRTVGWFTALFPVLLELDDAAAAPAALRAVKEQLRAVPRRGLGFGLWRYLGAGSTAPDAAGELAADLPRPEVLFNYLGQLDASVAAGRLVRPAPEAAGPLRHPEQRRWHAIEINAAVLGGRLRATWTYSRGRHRAATIAGLAEHFRRALRGLIAARHAPAAAALTASDFPLARLDQGALRTLLAATAAAPGGGIEDLYPVTPLQQGMLFHALEDPTAGVYVEQVRLGLEVGGAAADAPEAAAQERAWDALLERHAALRTSLWLDGEVPLQVVHRRLRVDWRREDWRGVAAGEQRRRLAAFLRDDRRHGFDLTRPPLLRLTWIQLGERHAELVWTFHHVLLDGWSLPILLRDLLALYQEALHGRPARLAAAAPPAFRDYLAWLGQQDAAAAERFWRAKLAGFTTSTPLGLERPRTAGAAASAAASAAPGTAPGTELGQPAVAEVVVRLPGARGDALREFVRRRQITLNTLVQGAWALLLSACGGGDDVVFGVVSSGRSAPLAGIEEMVGLLINTLPARIHVAPGRAPVEWLQEIQRQQAELRQYEHSALDQVRTWSEVAPGLPLFESLLAFENYPLDQSVRDEVGGGLGVRSVEMREQTNYPLHLIVEPGARLGLRLAYDPRRFARASMVRLLSHLETVLAAIQGEAVPTLADVPLLDAAERHQMLMEWNAAPSLAAAAGLERSCDQLFEARAARQPQAPAVICGERWLSFDMLNAQANRLAHHLRRRGVGAEALVGVCLERSPELVIALLAILKTGGAYLPLDPGHPPARLAALLDDAGARLLVGRSTPAAAGARLQAIGEMSGGRHIAVVDLDAQREEIGSESGADLGLSAAAGLDRLAYVIYTSGSTGRPKGVMVHHRALASYLAWAAESYRSPAGGGSLIHTSVAFDLTVTSLFVPLLWGEPVELVAESPGVEGLAAALRARPSPGFLKLTPSHARLLAQSGRDGEPPPAVRALVVGGEILTAEDLAPWRDAAPGTTIFNEYGPTETVVGCCLHATTAGELAAGALPIGRPISGARVYVVDRRLQPVPAGVAGELCVGGLGVTRGYLGRPDATAERFVPDPWSGAPGARMYRTGDLARQRHDGAVDCLGRLDDQVKIRGFRVEPGEIEASLLGHPGVAAAVVVVREDQPGEQLLTAYVVPDAGAGAPRQAIDALRAHLHQRLPEHMVPAAFVLLAALPLSANGKLDRRALPAPRPLPEAAFADPEGEVERTVAEVWREVLRAERVGRHDNFFDLGGHSMLMLRVLRKLQQRCGRQLSMLDLFRAPTVAAMAALLAGEAASPEAAAVTQDAREEERREGRDRLQQRLRRQQEV